MKEVGTKSHMISLYICELFGIDKLKDRKHIDGSPGVAGGRREGLFSGYGVYLGIMEDILELDIDCSA